MSTILDDIANNCVDSRILSGDLGLEIAIFRRPDTRFECLVATSSRGLPNSSAGSPLTMEEFSESGAHEAVGPAVTLG